MTVVRIDHVQLAMPRGREAEARTFYEGALGLCEVAKPAHLAVRGGCWFALADVKLHLGVDEDFHPARKAHPALIVDDLSAVADRLTRMGHPVTQDQPLEGYHRAYVDDPFGNRIELMQEALRDDVPSASADGDLRRPAGEPAKVLVSACLMGQPVRYNGSAKAVVHPVLDRLKTAGRLVVVCPELSAGFSVPRPSAEISKARDGRAVLAGDARVVERTGGDVTERYVDAAHAALALAIENGCRFALLTDGSPSCGSRLIYDGSFGGRTHAGAGVTAELLRQHGIEVFAETEIEALERRIA